MNSSELGYIVVEDPLIEIKGEQIQFEADSNYAESDRIQNFDTFINELNSKSLPIYSWQFHKQADGICFYKLTRDVNFSDLKFSAKILIDSQMNLKIFAQDIELKESDIGIRKLHYWEQFRMVLENFDSFQEYSGNAKHHIQKAIEHLELSYNMQDNNEFKTIVYSSKEKLEKLLEMIENDCWESYEVEEVHSQSIAAEDNAMEECEPSEDMTEADFDLEENLPEDEDLVFQIVTTCCGAGKITFKFVLSYFSFLNNFLLFCSF